MIAKNQKQCEADKIDDELILKACAKMDIFELRQYARIVGLSNAQDYARNDLMKYILDIENGRMPPASKDEVFDNLKFYSPE